MGFSDRHIALGSFLSHRAKYDSERLVVHEPLLFRSKYIIVNEFNGEGDYED
jgi:hypothetical protein